MDQWPHKKIYLTIFIVLLITVLFSHLSTVELRGEEPRRAIVSMEMAITGDYIVPKINGCNYYNKPPLFNWVLVLFFKIFGSYENWVVRIPSLICFLLCGLASYIFANKYLNRETALLSTMFFLTSGEILFYATLFSGEIDLFFTLLVCLQIMGMYHFFRQKQWLWMFLISYGLSAAGFLTKGLPAVLFQGVTLAIITIYYRKWRMLFSWQHLLGIFTFCMVTVSYFFVYAQREDVTPFLINLFAEASQKTGMNSSPIKLITSALLYPFEVLKWTLPWSVFSIYFFSRKTIHSIRQKEVLAFLALFVLANLPVYWLTDNPKSRYIFMFFPFMMMLFTHAYLSRKKDWPIITRTVMILFGIVVVVVPAIALILPWLTQTVSLDHSIRTSALVFIPSALLAWLYFKSKTNRLCYFILSLLMVRLMINLYILPSIQENSVALVNLGHLQTILEITGEEPLFISGEPFTQENDLAIGRIQMVSSEISTAPIISYFLPYYYTKLTHRVLTYEPDMEAGKLYLVYTKDIQEEVVDFFYRYEEPSTKDEIALARMR